MRYLLTVLLIAALAACSRPGATGVSVPSAFRPLIPPDTKALAGVDLDKLKASAFYQRHQSQLNFPMLDAMSERVGLDPRRDISDLLIVWNGKDVLALARGGFNVSTIEAKLPSIGARPTSYKGFTLFEEDRDVLAFLKHGVAVAGRPQLVKSEIDLANGGVPDELQTRLATIPKTDQIWLASRGGLAIDELSLRSDYESLLSNIAGYINATSLGLGFDTGTHLQAEIVCVSKEGAQRVHDALRGGIGLARLTTRDGQSDLLKLYDAVQVSQDQQTVHIKADVSAELTDKLLDYLPSIRNRADQVLQR